VAQYYTNRYHQAMDALNVLPPSIEPHATGHIIEQIQLVREILANGYAYESNGSIYFDIEKYNKDHRYGRLSGRNLDDIINNSRDLAGVDEKHNQADFALWKKAQPEHIMRWPSPWSDGFPGWHCECTAMGRKYLGNHFDIHGGGMDLVFPHHECEIAQSVASQGDDMVHYWVHNNMITINGQKMGKSLNNFITLPQFFSGEHEKLEKPYSPMTIRFFILQAHYRSTVDFSNEALQAAEKGLERLLDAYNTLNNLTTDGDAALPKVEMAFVDSLREKCYEAMNDDFATPNVISNLFDATRTINSVADKKATIAADVKEALIKVFDTFAFELLGLKPSAAAGNADNAAREQAYGKVVDMLLEQRLKAKANKDWATSDMIRDNLSALGFEVKDTKDGFTWKLNV
jgi:cysteinyl-tRNA synthetase